MVFSDTPYSVSRKPSAFLRYQSLSWLPGIPLFCWARLCPILFHISSSCFTNDLKNTGPSTNNFSPLCCDFEDCLSEWKASFLWHSFITSIKAFVEIPARKVLKCQWTWKSQTNWISPSTCSSILSKVSVLIPLIHCLWKDTNHLSSTPHTSSFPTGVMRAGLVRCSPGIQKPRLWQGAPALRAWPQQAMIETESEGFLPHLWSRHCQFMWSCAQAQTQAAICLPSFLVAFSAHWMENQ